MIVSLAALSGVLFGGWANPITAIIMTSTTAVAIVLALDQRDQPQGAVPASPSPRSAWERGAATGLGVGVAVAAVGALGDLAWPLALVACLTSPPALRLLCSSLPAVRDPSPRGRRSRLRRQSGSAAPAAPPAPVIEVGTKPWRSAAQVLDDHQLCHGWRASYTCLMQAPTSEARLELVQIRQAYLDELERRHPAGLRAWLQSGARAAGDPSRHLHLARRPGER